MTRRLPVLPSYTPAAVHGHARASFATMLRGPRAAAVAEEIGALAGVWTDDGITHARREASEPALACRESCASCCYLKVVVSAPEAIALAAHIGRLDEGARRAVISRIAATDTRTRGMTAQQRVEARIPCPMLEEDRCAAYEARPTACRAATSYDRSGCERALSNPGAAAAVPFSAVAKSMCDATRGAACGSAMEAGLDGRLLELVAAVRIAIERPDAGGEWARGRPAFRFAVDDEIEAKLKSERRRR